MRTNRKSHSMLTEAMFAILCAWLCAPACGHSPLEPPFGAVPNRSSLAENVTSRLLSDSGGPVVLEGTELALCECEQAHGSPDGLSCGPNKEGWFISNFEKEGSWLLGGGLVPLSHAICCRPCLPEAPADPRALAVKEIARSIISIGCHASVGSGPSSLQCEPGGSSLVTGWSQAVHVSSSIAASYPLGPAACCTPVVVLARGDAVELERCDCVASPDINCGGLETHRLLVGFQQWRLTSANQFVPVAPAECCKMCLSGREHPASECAGLNGCSGRGVCILGSCQCMAGYYGPDCSHQDSAGGLPQWLMVLIITCCCVTLSALLAVVKRLLRLRAARRRGGAPDSDAGSESGDPLRAALLLRSGDDGSVGSRDTTDCEAEAPPPARAREELVRAAAVAAQEGAEALEPYQAPALQTAPSLESSPPPFSPPPHGIPLATRRARRHGAIRRSGPSAVGVAAGAPEAPGGPQGAGPGSAGLEWESADDEASDVEAGLRPVRPAEAQPEVEAASPWPGVEARDGEAGLPSDDAPDKPSSLLPGASRGGLLGVDCSVCMCRPVQVALIPCGHACMCRRCSRRLSRCPVCRKEISRRQRLFVGG